LDVTVAEFQMLIVFFGREEESALRALSVIATRALFLPVISSDGLGLVVENAVAGLKALVIAVPRHTLRLIGDDANVKILN
jgi:hypothetical protein